MSDNGYGASSLLVVGTGIQWAAHATLAAQAAIRDADSVLFAVTDAWSARWIRELNPRAESLKYPRDGRPRLAIYEEMVSRSRFWSSSVRGEFAPHSTGALRCSRGRRTSPVRRAREAGHQAAMLPVSHLWTACSRISGWTPVTVAVSCSKRATSCDEHVAWTRARTSVRVPDRDGAEPRDLRARSAFGARRALGHPVAAFGLLPARAHARCSTRRRRHPLRAARRRASRSARCTRRRSRSHHALRPPRKTAIDSARESTVFNETREWRTR